MIFALFHCVGESVVARGIVSLAREIPFGSTLIDVASDAWRRFRARKATAEMRAEVQQIAQAAAEDVKKAAAEAAREAFPNDRDKAVELELYLTQIPATVRQSLRRQDDPTGTTVPLAFALDTPESLLPLLPVRVSKFRPGDALPGRDGWKLTDLLGTGGFGEVWLAAHPHFASLKRAVKFCLELTDKDRTLLHEGGLIDRVMRAGPVPNVVPLIDANLTGEAPWLMYEYVAGGDLVSLVASSRELPLDKRHALAVAGLKQITRAVAHFHRLGVVHRDLKPANVLVSGDRGQGTGDRKATARGSELSPGSCPLSPELKVADFGIGGISASHELALDQRMTSSGARMATVARGAFTPIYASPQQKRGNPPDPRDDVFALGVIGYQMLAADVTAERPGGKGWRRELQARGVKPELLDVLESCWDDSAAERPADAGELLARLERVGGKPTPPPVPPPKPPVSDSLPIAKELNESPSMRRGLFLLVLVFLLVGASISFWTLREEGGGAPATPSAEVSGRVTYKGNPVEGTITFLPVNGTVGGLRAVSGDIKEGKYSLRPMPGEYVVRISSPRSDGEKFTPDVPNAPAKGDGKPAPGERIPARYNTNSTLHYTVHPGSQAKDFDLTD